VEYTKLQTNSTIRIGGNFMFHKVKSVIAINDYKLVVIFAEGITKIYDIKPLFTEFDMFNGLKENRLFYEVVVDVGGYGVSWNDDIDLSCDELFENGETVDTPFDNLIALSDATILWGLNESTLRKAISYGKLQEGIDVMKYGKQWIITMEAMVREYGEPKSR
jgi:hypothetical protein